MRFPRVAGNLVLATAAVIAAVGIAEAALQFSNRPPAVPEQVLCGCPYLYGLNPRSPGISSQGLRDRAFVIPKPPGTLRVLVLGDSVAFGVRVPPERTFSKVLEQMLDRPERHVEVVNAGVPGYTAYNELQYYVARGRELRPDVVVVAFCMNDAVDPELHWSGSRRRVPDIPDEAIPNRAYHDTHVAQMLGPRLPLIGRRSELLRRVAMLRHPRSGPGWEARRHVTVAGKKWPTYVTGDDDFSIRVLLDPDSPEWRWLRSIYGRLRAAVEADGGRLILLVLPLAYQLDDGYPFLPQQVFADYCRAERLLCVDVLGAMRARRAEAMFPSLEWPDVWHPTIAGHQVVAEELAEFLRRESLPP